MRVRAVPTDAGGDQGSRGPAVLRLQRPVGEQRRRPRAEEGSQQPQARPRGKPHSSRPHAVVERDFLYGGHIAFKVTLGTGKRALFKIQIKKTLFPFKNTLKTEMFLQSHIK